MSKIGFRILFNDRKGKYHMGIVTRIIRMRQKKLVVNTRNEGSFIIGKEDVIYSLPKCEKCEWCDKEVYGNICHYPDTFCEKCENHLLHEFIDYWKQDWYKIQFFKVKNMVKEDKKIICHSYTSVKEGDLFETTNIVYKLSDIPEEFRGKEESMYYDYYGFCRDNDEDVWFNRDHYSMIDLDVHMSGKFSRVGQHNFGHYIPKEGDMICGILKYRHGTGKPYLDSWFVCSPQFVMLHKLLYASHQISLTETDMNLLETAPWMRVITFAENDPSIESKMLRYESAYLNYTSIYSTLALLITGQVDKISLNEDKISYPVNLIKDFMYYTEQRIKNRWLLTVKRNVG